MPVVILGLVLGATFLLALILANATRSSRAARRTRWSGRGSDMSSYYASSGTDGADCSSSDAGAGADCGGADGGGGGGSD